MFPAGRPLRFGRAGFDLVAAWLVEIQGLRGLVHLAWRICFRAAQASEPAAEKRLAARWRR